VITKTAQSIIETKSLPVSSYLDYLPPIADMPEAEKLRSLQIASKAYAKGSAQDLSEPLSTYLKPHIGVGGVLGGIVSQLIHPGSFASRLPALGVGAGIGAAAMSGMGLLHRRRMARSQGANQKFLDQMQGGDNSTATKVLETINAQQERREPYDYQDRTKP